MTSPAPQERSPVIASLVFLAADVAAYAGLVVHTLLSRRRYVRGIEELVPGQRGMAADFFLLTPASVYAAAFLLLVVSLIVKECAIERKGVTLRINIAALAGALALFAVYLWKIKMPIEKVLSP